MPYFFLLLFDCVGWYKGRTVSWECKGNFAGHGGIFSNTGMRALFMTLCNVDFVAFSRFFQLFWGQFFFNSVMCKCALHIDGNRPCSSEFINPHFQNEAKYTTFLVKMRFICIRMKNHLYIKGWALNLVLIQSPRWTRKWSILFIFFCVHRMTT